MKVTFEYQVPNKHLLYPDLTAVLRVDAEVLNPGLPTETPLIQRVSSSGPTALWKLQTSEELFSDVCNAAIAHARFSLQKIDQAIDHAIKNHE